MGELNLSNVDIAIDRASQRSLIDSVLHSIKCCRQFEEEEEEEVLSLLLFRSCCNYIETVCTVSFLIDS